MRLLDLNAGRTLEEDQAILKRLEAWLATESGRAQLLEALQQADILEANIRAGARARERSRLGKPLPESEKRLCGELKANPKGVGWPAMFYLHLFGAEVHRLFGIYPVLVGSCLTSKDRRDIDVRLILPNSVMARWKPVMGDDHTSNPGGRWDVLQAALSAMASAMTGGLPIDFQVQSMGEANRQNMDADCKEPDPKPWMPLGNWMPVKLPELAEDERTWNNPFPASEAAMAEACRVEFPCVKHAGVLDQACPS